MSYIVEKSDRSSRDIEEAFVYIGENDLDKGIEFLIAIGDSLELLAENPQMGWVRDFNNSAIKDLRVWRVKGFESYLLIYQILPQFSRLRLMRLINSSRDFQLISI